MSGEENMAFNEIVAPLLSNACCWSGHKVCIDGKTMKSLLWRNFEGMALLFTNVSVETVAFFNEVLLWTCNPFAVVWLVCSEIFPSSVKGRAVSITGAVNWIVNVLVSFTFLDYVGKLTASLHKEVLSMQSSLSHCIEINNRFQSIAQIWW